ncbi:hypothetical protein ANCCAN_18536 [Ancylostoma caninum]|uniref:Neurotransmitter-gated ion-channel ligand-binding domain-containing protein n=1 Tax=Ancylostoma caninum TaxID=29170 RepID=A0A368FZ56_ANCCA|nr:hypothetical protein ANCCAN_18536 [Ancylostoma caninum]
MSALFSNYKKELRPVKTFDSGPTNVTVQLYFKQIQKVQENDQIITIYCWLEEVCNYSNPLLCFLDFLTSKFRSFLETCTIPSASFFLPHYIWELGDPCKKQFERCAGAREFRGGGWSSPPQHVLRTRDHVAMSF